jgi:transcriptional regulator with XRE-family HTH domain
VGKFVSEAKQLRFELQVKLGRAVSQGEIADRIQVDRRVIMRIENNKFQELDRPVIERLADLYYQEGLDASRILYYIPDEEEELGEDQTINNKVPLPQAA